MSLVKITYKNINYFTGIDNDAWLKNFNEDSSERPAGAPPGHFLLRTTDTSPFARKVRIVAEELGLASRITMSPADFSLKDTELVRSNPIAKIPVLETDQGESIIESTQIVQYLCSITDELGEKIRPTDKNLALINSQIETVADSATSAAMLAVMEKRLHDENAVSDQWLTRQNGKVTRSLNYLTQQLNRLQLTHSGSIASACLLSYLDWREHKWRTEFPYLKDWLANFESNIPAFEKTKAF